MRRNNDILSTIEILSDADFKNLSKERYFITFAFVCRLKNHIKKRADS
jgi:hypothetical protein